MSNDLTHAFVYHAGKLAVANKPHPIIARDNFPNANPEELTAGLVFTDGSLIYPVFFSYTYNSQENKRDIIHQLERHFMQSVGEEMEYEEAMSKLTSKKVSAWSGFSYIYDKANDRLYSGELSPHFDGGGDWRNERQYYKNHRDLTIQFPGLEDAAVGDPDNYVFGRLMMYRDRGHYFVIENWESDMMRDDPDFDMSASQDEETSRLLNEKLKAIIFEKYPEAAVYDESMNRISGMWTPRWIMYDDNYLINNGEDSTHAQMFRRMVPESIDWDWEQLYHSMQGAGYIYPHDRDVRVEYNNTEIPDIDIENAVWDLYSRTYGKQSKVSMTMEEVSAEVFFVDGFRFGYDPDNDKLYWTVGHHPDIWMALTNKGLTDRVQLYDEGYQKLPDLDHMYWGVYDKRYEEVTLISANVEGRTDLDEAKKEEIRQAFLSLQGQPSARPVKMTDYQGWTNWDTWNTSLMIDNERESYDMSRKLIEQGKDEEFINWAIETIIGPSNARSLEDAQEWNDIPEHDRLDPHYEEFKDQHGDNENVMDLLHGLVGGPDVSDYTPDLIDAELVNWDEIIGHIREEFEENEQFERDMKRNEEAGWLGATNHDETTNILRDAYLRWLGATTDKDIYKAILVPIEELKRSYFNDRHWEEEVVPKGGYEQSLSEIANDAVGAVKNDNSQASPEAQANVQRSRERMTEALVAQGYGPEEIEALMKPVNVYDPETQEWNRVDGYMDRAKPIDKTLDQPGDLTIPSEWTAKCAGFWPRVSADVEALAEKARQRTLSENQSLRDASWYPGVPDGANTWDVLRTLLKGLKPDGFKLFPWIGREFKRATIPQEGDLVGPIPGIHRINYTHAKDIINNAIDWMIWSREHNKPLPEMNRKEFDFNALESWVYEMNAQNVDLSNGIEWQDSTTVYEYPDGWKMMWVGEDDLAQEGELMGHCVGGYCNSVRSGDTSIYSLRDPQGEPHVTIEMETDLDLRESGGGKTIYNVQTQGKGNRAPIAEYQNKVDEWFQSLKDNNWEIEEGSSEPDWDNAEDRDYWGDTTTYPPTLDGLEDFFDHIHNRPYEFMYDEDPEYEVEGRDVYRITRVPNFIEAPDRTWTDQEGVAHPASANVHELLAPLAGLINRLWANQDYDPKHWAEVFWAAVHHVVGRYRGGADQNQVEKQFIEQMNGMIEALHAKKVEQAGTPKQDALFDAEEYVDLQIPEKVRTFQWYLTNYLELSHEKMETTRPMMYYDKFRDQVPGEDHHFNDMDTVFDQMHAQFPDRFKLPGALAKVAARQYQGELVPTRSSEHGMGFPFIYSLSRDKFWVATTECFHWDLIAGITDEELKNQVNQNYISDRDGLQDVLIGRAGDFDEDEGYGNYINDWGNEEYSNRIGDELLRHINFFLDEHGLEAKGEGEEDHMSKVAAVVELNFETIYPTDDPHYGKRRPIIYLPNVDTAYIGPLGSYHHELSAAIDEFYPDDRTRGYYAWGGRPFEGAFYYDGEVMPDDVKEEVDSFLNGANEVFGSFKRFANFRIVADKIRELADKAYEKLMQREDLIKIRELGQQEWNENEERMNANEIGENDLPAFTLSRKLWAILAVLNKNSPETYKMWPWVVRELKKGRLPSESIAGMNHIIDILRQSKEHLDKMRDDPRGGVPDVNQMTWEELEAWTYEKNAELAKDEDVDPNTKVEHDFGNGYTIKRLGADDLAREGELMGHCVGGYCQQVRDESTIIYSLRDAKNEPHVTIEIEPMAGDGGEPARVVQVQGKSNQTPAPEYAEMITAWFDQMYDKPVWGPSGRIDSDWELEEYVNGLDNGMYGLESGEVEFDWMYIVDGEIEDDGSVYSHTRSEHIGDAIGAQPDPEGEYQNFAQAFERWVRDNDYYSDSDFQNQAEEEMEMDKPSEEDESFFIEEEVGVDDVGEPEYEWVFDTDAYQDALHDWERQVEDRAYDLKQERENNVDQTMEDILGDVRSQAGLGRGYRGRGYYSAAQEFKYEYVPNDDDVWDPERIPWIFDTETGTLWYSDFGAYHASILQEMGADAETGAEVSYDGEGDLVAGQAYLYERGMTPTYGVDVWGNLPFPIRDALDPIVEQELKQRELDGRYPYDYGHTSKFVVLEPPDHPEYITWIYDSNSQTFYVDDRFHMYMLNDILQMNSTDPDDRYEVEKDLPGWYFGRAWSKSEMEFYTPNSPKPEIMAEFQAWLESNGIIV